MPSVQIEPRNGFQQPLYSVDSNLSGDDEKKISNSDLDVASQGFSYADYSQQDASKPGSGLDELLILRRRLALQRALNHRNGLAGVTKDDLSNDLTGSEAYLDNALLLNNRDSGLLGLGSSGYGDDFGYDTHSADIGGYGYNQCSQNGLNPLLLLLTLALAAAGYYIMYTRLNAIAGKRKKREESDGFFSPIYDTILAGGLFFKAL